MGEWTTEKAGSFRSYVTVKDIFVLDPYFPHVTCHMKFLYHVLQHGTLLCNRLKGNEAKTKLFSCFVQIFYHGNKKLPAKPFKKVNS